MIRRSVFAGLLVIAAPVSAGIDARRQDIPPVFRGTWALSPDICKEQTGPAFVKIGARHIYFYERSGYLNLARLNYADDPPQFYGAFFFNGLLEFWHQVIRLDLRDGKLFVSEIKTSDDPPSTAPWTKCSNNEGDE